VVVGGGGEMEGLTPAPAACCARSWRMPHAASSGRTPSSGLSGLSSSSYSKLQPLCFSLPIVSGWKS
jgi:hypothetical protein